VSADRTLVCSVLFLDIADYSQKGVAEQIRLKQSFNAVLAASLENVDAHERVIIDTGDGAAIAFLGDPQSALFAALAVFDNVGELPVRMGINLGPVYLARDINDQQNVIGDGINVAQRIMSFAQAGELLVSRSFYEVVQLLSGDYAKMFKQEGSRADKHNRAHELYSVSQAVRVGRRVAEAQARMRAKRSVRPQAQAAEEPARIADAGSHFIVSGSTRQSVDAVLERLGKEGVKLLSPPALVGAKWMATCENRRHAARVNVEQFGLKSIISDPIREAVEAKVRELQQFGAAMVQEIECVDGVWTAVCERN
jgi:class 3 adenylate cyclase